MERNHEKLTDADLVNKLVMVAKVLENAHRDKGFGRKIAEYHEELEHLKEELLRRLSERKKGDAR